MGAILWLLPYYTTLHPICCIPSDFFPCKGRLTKRLIQERVYMKSGRDLEKWPLLCGNPPVLSDPTFVIGPLYLSGVPLSVPSYRTILLQPSKGGYRTNLHPCYQTKEVIGPKVFLALGLLSCLLYSTMKVDGRRNKQQGRDDELSDLTE